MTTGKFDRPTRVAPRRATAVETKPETKPEPEPLLGSEPEAEPEAAAPDTVETPVEELEARMTSNSDLVERIEANRQNPDRLVKHDPVAEIEAVEQAKRDASAAAAAKLTSTDFEVGGREEPYLAGGVPVEHAVAVKESILARERRGIQKAMDRFRGRK